MKQALRLAQEAYADDETPIGCIITNPTGDIIGRGRNRRNKTKNALAHAEMEAISNACNYTGDWRLDGCSIYVTIEPCPMCAGAIVTARIRYVFFGAYNKKAGCGGSILDVLNEPRFNHRCVVTGGVLADECGAIMTRFFARFK